MPSAEASCGEPSGAGSPSNSTSPESYDWTPARPLISVDLPAPLSPTSALTLPGWTSMSTPLSTSTGPKLLRMSRSSMRAVMDVLLLLLSRRHDDGRARCARAHHHCSNGFCLVDAGLRAGGLDVAGAHVGDLGVAVVEHLLHVLRGHDGGRLGDERRPVRGLLVDGRLLALQQLLAQIDGRLSLELVRLVDGAELLAQQDVLQAGRGGVLAAHGDLLAVLVEHRDRGAGVGVVGRPDGVDLAVQRGVALLEERLRLRLVPRARGLERRLDARGRHLVVRALVKLGRVAVGRVAAAVDDLGRLRVLAL